MQIDSNKVSPLPGYMIVKLEACYQDVGLIKIPERFKKALRLVGKITAINPRPIDIQTLGYVLSVGDRIIVTPLGGRALTDNEQVFPITVKCKRNSPNRYRDSGVLAIIGDNIDMSASSQDIERCMFCGPAKDSNQNIILFDGVCPRCGKAKNGEIPDKAVKVSDAEVEEFEESMHPENN